MINNFVFTRLIKMERIFEDIFDQVKMIDNYIIRKIKVQIPSTIKNAKLKNILLYIKIERI